jgi:hypothetical protein
VLFRSLTVAANRFSTTGFVAPTRYTTTGGTDTMGFGRFYTVTEAALGFICNADGASGNLTVPRATLAIGNSSSTQTLTLNSSFTLNSTAWSLASGNTSIQLSGLNCTVNGTTANLTQNATLVATINPISGIIPSGNATLTINATQLAQMISNNTNNGTAINYLPKTTNSTTTVILSNATTYNGNQVLGGTPLAAAEKYIQAIFVPEFFSPMFGWSELNDGKFRMRVTGLENLTVTVGGATQNLFPASVSDTATNTRNNESGFWGKRLTGSPGPAYFAVGKGSPARGSLPADSTNPDAVYPYIGTPIKITAPVTGGTMAFTGGNITIELYADNTALPAPGAARDARLMQKIQIQIPNGTFPVPNLVSTGTVIENNTGAADRNYQSDTTIENWWAFSTSRSQRVGWPATAAACALRRARRRNCCFPSLFRRRSPCAPAYS